MVALHPRSELVTQHWDYMELRPNLSIVFTFSVWIFHVKLLEWSRDCFYAVLSGCHRDRSRGSADTAQAVPQDRTWSSLQATFEGYSTLYSPIQLVYIFPNSDATSFEKFVSVCYGQSPLLKPCIAITVFSACLYPCYSVSTLSLSSNVCMCSTFAQGYKPFRSLGTNSS